MLNGNIVGGNPKKERHASDFYPTPPEVTIALMDFLELGKGTAVWDPACGEGDMTAVFAKYGLLALGSDIQTGVDFTTVLKGRGGLEDIADWIITNPPFSLAEEFIERCVEIGRPFALLLKTQFWHAARREELFYKYPPSYILPLTWRPDFLFKEPDRAGKPLMDVCWNVWLGTGELFRLCSTEYRPLSRPTKEHLKEIMK